MTRDKYYYSRVGMNYNTVKILTETSKKLDIHLPCILKPDIYDAYMKWSFHFTKRELRLLDLKLSKL